MFLKYARNVLFCALKQWENNSYNKVRNRKEVIEMMTSDFGYIVIHVRTVV
ncbi:hypothetical protein AVV23_gp35 [Paenibacillus phage Sitara]|uniref:Uncharacterized protein n=2 Tax=Fernvirus TaxID=2843380 RepID=A0A0K2CYD1_9CAUD|nr:hypothetical protein XENIA_40 [Paenibacillus phage Xenia]YP_009203480.1 hypothetical protein AVV23_gp35 [Paenibacillus phage Sitara]AJK28023.1 hypothetical protein SITARA_35 [Paenibacillus phage Sitara]ALA12559.1 hypothetical protein XENIA_40 [Paenibacillus phage Xenia]UYL93453.1 hypothetical protein VB_PLAS1A_38 [Paenibacillus phage vB_PlaS-1/A]